MNRSTAIHRHQRNGYGASRRRGESLKVGRTSGTGVWFISVSSLCIKPL